MSAALEEAFELGFSYDFFDQMCRWLAPAEEVPSSYIETRWPPNTRAQALAYCQLLHQFKGWEVTPHPPTSSSPDQPQPPPTRRNHMDTITRTLADIEQTSGLTAYDWLPRDIEVPELDGLQAQGDLLVVPTTRTAGAGATDVPAGPGIELVKGDQGGHTHSLVAPDGGCTVHLRDTSVGGSTDDLVVALVTCTKPVFLMHPEHGASGIAPGNYEIRRQREFNAAEARRIAD